MKIRARKNIHMEVGDGTMFWALRGQVVDDVDDALAKRLIKTGLAVEYKPEKVKPSEKPEPKRVWVKALNNVFRSDPHVYLLKGQKGRVSEAMANALIKLGLAVKTTAPLPEPADPASAS